MNQPSIRTYRVIALGGMWLMGLHRDYGDVIELDGDEAKYPDLADAIELFTSAYGADNELLLLGIL